ncbi:MAG: histidine triad family protein [Actinomycetota bacterium]|jgi:histidine triad (HIT) family protein|nr:histidine triad family protein [Actinomycetota bacterium]
MDSNCIFCSIIAGAAPSYLIYQDDTAVAFLDIAPVRQGHTLVVPRSHVADLLAEGGAQALADTAAAVHHVSRQLRDAFDADGISIFQSNGAAAGQEVFHVHLHVIPRHAGDRLPLRWVRDSEAADTVAATFALLSGA